MADADVPDQKKATYPEYRSSDLDWVDRLPAHWKSKRLKYLATVQFSHVDKKTHKHEEPVQLCNYVDVYYNDFITPRLDFMSASASLSEISQFSLEEGDVLITKDSEAWDDIAVPAYVCSGLDGVLCGYHLAHVRPDLDKVDARYLFRAFSARGVNEQFRVAATGITRFGLGNYWISNGRFPLPPIEEQRAIADFLDRETERIDAMVAKKEKLIDLLEEKRAALISHAVTKGLDPDAPMKDSGIDWLGHIPKRWQQALLRRFIHVKSGDMIRRSDLCQEGYPVWGGNGFRGFTEQWNTEARTIIIGRYGALCGNVRLAETKIWATEHAFRVIPLNDFSARYFAYLLTALDLNRFSARAAQPGLNSDIVRNNVAAIPPRGEQRAIADFLDRRTASVDALVAKNRQVIKKLQEYRTALISAAVTGKINVRGEVS